MCAAVCPCSEADDRFGDQTYQRATSIPDSLPVALDGADWREFRWVARWPEQLHS